MKIFGKIIWGIMMLERFRAVGPFVILVHYTDIPELMNERVDSEFGLSEFEGLEACSEGALMFRGHKIIRTPDVPAGEPLVLQTRVNGYTLAYEWPNDEAGLVENPGKKEK